MIQIFPFFTWQTNHLIFPQKIQINSSPVRPYDIQKDKTISGMDLMEISYTFELEGKSTWFTVYLWMNIFESFEEKLDGLFAK